MAILKCKMCGAQLDVIEGKKTIQCRYCDSIQTISKLDDEFKLKMLDRATELRLRCEFDQSASVFQSIIAQFSDEAEAYWGLCLCKYGIEYVNDPKTLAKIPTCRRTHPQSILSDSNYLNACEYAGASRYKYEEEALEIDKLQKKILDISHSEEPYDIFICYKETDDEIGVRTDDSVTAQDIYTELVKSGYRVFYSRVTLRGKADGEFEPYIYAALASAKIMLVLGSKKSYFDAVWVKNEWQRYLDMMQNSSKTIIPCYEKMGANEIPVQLRNFQALDMGNKIFFSDLTASIERIIPRKSYAPKQESKRETDISATPRPKEINLDDGVYVGEAIGNRFHGYGTRFFENGDKFEGNWNMGKRNGNGIFTFNNGDTWNGEWKNDVPWNGTGIWNYSVQVTEKLISKIHEEGSYKEGKLVGEGLRYRNGNLTEKGMFENGELNGFGERFRKGELLCSGEWKNGRPWNAQGEYTLLGPDKKYFGDYKGKWVNGLPEGNGNIVVSGNGRITGNFINGLNGTVTWIFKDERRYEGTIKNGNLSGHGKIFAKDGRLIYDGNYENGKAHGYGIQYFNSGERYEGEFHNSKRNGQGTYYYPQGSWTGEWKDDARWKGNGLTIFYDKNGKPTGKFFNGYMVNGKAAGRGILRFEDGSRFDGEFLNDNYYNGTVYNVNNQIIDTYINGESQQQKAHNRNQAIAGTALGILRGFTGI